MASGAAIQRLNVVSIGALLSAARSAAAQTGHHVNNPMAGNKHRCGFLLLRVDPDQLRRLYIREH
jgi:hypothetical protein